MAEADIQNQINDINHKLDILIQHVDQQRLRSEKFQDLVKDVTIVGNEMFLATVEELDKKNVELDTEQLMMMFMKLLKNVGNLNQVISTFESMNDLVKDLGPIVTSVGFDAIAKISEFEQKGYFVFLKEIGNMVDNIITHFTLDDVKALSANVVTILDTVKNLSQPELLNSVNNAVKVFESIDTENVPSVSIWKMMREMNSPEMKKGMGFMITFMKNMANQNNKQIS